MPDPVQIRFASPADVPTIFSLIQLLAEYEKLSHAVVGDAAAIGKHLFGDRPYVETLLAEADGQLVGFALFFTSYSTLLAQPGIYLEDLFVLPDYRGRGVGKALLSHLAQLVLGRQWGWLEWSVLDWNAPAIAFYRHMGAVLLEEVRVCRVTDAALAQLAAGSTAPVRVATPADTAAMVGLARANAEQHGSLPEFANQDDLLAQHLFGDRPYAEAIVTEQDGQISSFAVSLHNYSTFLTKPGLYVEDLFVLPEYWEAGHGNALFAALAQRAVARDCGRVEWFVQAGNEAAIAFYERLGAAVLPDWRVCRVKGAALAALAQQEAGLAAKS